MRSLEKNKRKIYYSQFSGNATIYERDGEGNIIYDEVDGEDYPRILSEGAAYEAPISIRANISAARGNSETDVFGTAIDYTKTLSTTEMDLPINEKTIVWYETTPVIRRDGTVDETSADYSVVAVARSLTNVVYALRKRAKNA